MDVITLLIQDHRHVAGLLKQLSATTKSQTHQARMSLFEKFEKELIQHTAFEEKFFYPGLKKNPKTKDITFEAYQEHHVISHVLKEICTVAFDHDVWKAKLTVLKNNIEHHVMEEEQDLFPKVKKILSHEELVELGKEYQLFKQLSKTH